MGRNIKKYKQYQNLIVSTGFPQIPPKVKNNLFEKGRFLYPIMEAMCEWGEEYQNGGDKTTL